MSLLVERLQALEEKYMELGRLLSDPQVLANKAELQKYAKAYSDIAELVNKYKEYKKVVQNIKGAEEMIKDKDEGLRLLAKVELEELNKTKERLERELKVLLLPKDPRDEKNIIMEIRSGAGGEEAGLFAADLFRMYSKYAERQGWQIEVMNSHPTGIGGFKEIIFSVKGKGAYSKLKYESGVQRVQRIPLTEASGRIHTSTATVAILPEPEEMEVKIEPKDIRIDVFRATGPGGQGVNTTDSAVRITHLPTGIIVTCQDERSQLKNKAKAMRVLRARLLARREEERNAEIAENRRTQIKSGERSEKIRTYNFPQSRVTDHRIGISVYNLNAILEGELDELIGGLITADQVERLKRLGVDEGR